MTDLNFVEGEGISIHAGPNPGDPDVLDVEIAVLPDGDDGGAGGGAGVTVLTGTGVPDDADGEDGNLYLDLAGETGTETYFGPTDHSGGVWNIGAGYKLAQLITAPTSGNVTHVRGWIGSGGNCQMGLYVNSGGVPGALLGSSAVTATPGTAALTDFALTSPVAVVSGSSYFIACYSSSTPTQPGYVGSGAGWYYNNAGGLSNPFGTATLNSSTAMHLGAVIGAGSALQGSLYEKQSGSWELIGSLIPDHTAAATGHVLKIVAGVPAWAAP